MIKAIIKQLALFSLLGLSLNVSANLFGEEITFQRVFQGTARPEMPEEVTFNVTGGVEHTTGGIDQYTIDVQSDTIRVEVFSPGGTSFGDAPPHEMRFFIPREILSTSVVSSNFDGLSAANVSHTRYKLTIDINNLDPIPQDGYFEVTLTLGGPTKPVPIMAPWSFILLTLGFVLITFWHQKKRKLRDI